MLVRELSDFSPVEENKSWITIAKSHGIKAGWGTYKCFKKYAQYLNDFHLRGKDVKRRMIRTEEYEVETFLQRMVVEKGGREQFLLKWVGYDQTS